METPLGRYEKESMKMAMLKHEQTFKEQVYELHRLYRIQKILMKSIESSSFHAFAGNTSANSSSCCIDNKEAVSLLTLQQERVSESDNCVVEDAIDESQVELTLGFGPTSTSHFKSKKRVSPSDCLPSSFSTGSSGSTRRFDIHHRRDSESAVQFGSRRLEEGVESMNKQPPWIFQVLRLHSSG